MLKKTPCIWIYYIIYSFYNSRSRKINCIYRQALLFTLLVIQTHLSKPTLHLDTDLQPSHMTLNIVSIYTYIISIYNIVSTAKPIFNSKTQRRSMLFKCEIQMCSLWKVHQSLVQMFYYILKPVKCCCRINCTYEHIWDQVWIRFL